MMRQWLLQLGLLSTVILGHMTCQTVGLRILRRDDGDSDADVEISKAQADNHGREEKLGDVKSPEIQQKSGKYHDHFRGETAPTAEDQSAQRPEHQPVLGTSYVPHRQHKFDLNDFGGAGDGKTDNTRAFVNAVYACSVVSKSGGSQLYVPPGTYVTRPFNLTSHMTLYLANGATILGSTDVKEWDLIEPLPSYGRGWDLPGPRYATLISGYLINDVVITGENGTLDGRGQFWWDLLDKKELQHTRPHLLEFLHVRGAIVGNVTFRNSAFWTIHPVYSYDVTLRDVTIVNPVDSPNTEGIIPDSSQNVLIQDTYISTGADAIAVKSGWDEYGISYNMESSGIHGRNLVLHSRWGAAFAIGSEMSGGVRNVTLENVSIDNSANGVLVKTGRGRGGTVTDVTIKALYMSNVLTAINFTAFCDDHPDTHFNPKALPVVKRVTLTDIVANQIHVAASFHGLKEAPFQQVSLENVILGLVPEGKGFTCSNVDGRAINVHPRPCPQLKFQEWSMSEVWTKFSKEAGALRAQWVERLNRFQQALR